MSEEPAPSRISKLLLTLSNTRVLLALVVVCQLITVTWLVYLTAEAKEATRAAYYAASEASDASNAASDAKSEASDASDAASDAKSAAEAAQSSADDAQLSANAAKSTADDADDAVERLLLLQR